ncbi:DNA alkylation repair protein [Brevibacillus centrosporus]|uniref:DNA alkylation repair enzyme n=1 Tax=Brevibacillus centrosporus TaxID=54910 RepID=A0A1I3MI79_9BACL|nr:DNA alkylation repair protein [Brevibacillus centrosporus]SFI96727.1 DNA alkylation repair enzyme [Brevibacillus centrosporus]
MTVDEVMQKLEEMGTEQTKKTFLRHGAKEPFFGVRVGDMKKLVKEVKRDQELAREWIHSEEEMIAACGWNTYSNYLSITPDEKLDLDEIKSLLQLIQNTIHSERNRVRYTMNQFVIAVGAYVSAMHHEAVDVAARIGAVRVDMGQTACKVPLATEYIKKIEERGKIGHKKKTCIC